MTPTTRCTRKRPAAGPEPRSTAQQGGRPDLLGRPSGAEPGAIDPRAESAPESRVRIALVLAGLQPVPQFEVHARDRLLARVDLAFPEVRLAVEYEGAYHFEDDQIVRDDERYARLRTAGWTVIRLSAADLRDLDGVVARIRAAILSAEMAVSAAN